VVREASDRLLDFFIAAWLGLLDRVAPPRETRVDRAIREEGEGLRRALPKIDFDDPGVETLRSSDRR
jgi:hypothetical protein